MSNPLMKMIGGTHSGPLGRMSDMANIIRMLKSGNPEQIAQQMMQNNPKFRQFVEANKGKTPEQVAREYGVDLNQFKSMM